MELVEAGAEAEAEAEAEAAEPVALVLVLFLVLALVARKLALSGPTEALAAGPRALELELDSCEWLLELRECRAGTECRASDVELGRRACCFSRRAALAKLLSRGSAPRVLE